MKFHMVTHLERKCRMCRKILSARVHDYGEVTWEELDSQLDQNNFSLLELECPVCNSKGWPEDLVMYNIAGGKIEQAIRTKIGTDGLPVVGGENTPYGVAVSHEDQAEYDRGLAKKDDTYREKKKDFWTAYYEFAFGKWSTLLRELTRDEFAQAYEELDIPLLPISANATAWRRDAEKIFDTPEKRQIFWRAANRYLVEQEFVWMPIDTWPMEEWAKEYGKERIIYLTLHIPLPEELERWRSQKLAQVVKKKSGEVGVLFERIGQLGKELDKQRRRATQLSTMVMELRQESAMQAEQIGKLNQEVLSLRERPAELQPRDMDDARKICQLKGLIGELRAEVDRLTALMPVEDIAAAPEAEPEERAPVASQVTDLSVLTGKTILVVGWPRETIESEFECRVLWHHGDSVDAELQGLAREANIYVVLTRFISHQAMWWLKEAVIDRDVPIVFVRETNLKRIMEVVAEKIGRG